MPANAGDCVFRDPLQEGDGPGGSKAIDRRDSPVLLRLPLPKQLENAVVARVRDEAQGPTSRAIFRLCGRLRECAAAGVMLGLAIRIEAAAKVHVRRFPGHAMVRPEKLLRRQQVVEMPCRQPASPQELLGVDGNAAPQNDPLEIAQRAADRRGHVAALPLVGKKPTGSSPSVITATSTSSRTAATACVNSGRKKGSPARDRPPRRATMRPRVQRSADRPRGLRSSSPQRLLIPSR